MRQSGKSNASPLMKKSTKVSKARIERIRQLGAVQCKPVEFENSLNRRA